MINLFYEPFPDFVTVNGRNCPVVTDFREWIRLHDLLRDENVPQRSKIFLLAEWFVNPPALLAEAHIQALTDFYLVKDLELHKDEEDENAEPEINFKPPVFDWKIDSKYLIADFRQFYQINLLQIKYLHWFEFTALFQALPEESQCQKRIYYRSVDLRQIKDKNEKKRIRKIKKSIALPYEMSDEQIGAVLAAAL